MDAARRQAYLDALGIQAWLSRERLPAGQTVSNTPAGPMPAGESSPPSGGSPADMLRAAMRGQTPASLPEAAAPAPQALQPAGSPVAPGGDLAQLDWDQLAERVARCRACELHQSRTQTVFGVGNPDADLMIVGEAPGADEDRQGQPFVGRAGQLLNAMLAAIGLEREQVYIANILKCRPPANRNPSVEEAAACQGYLDRQIALIQPKLILSVGAISAQNLLASDQPVGKLRGRLHRLPAGVPVAVTYHPAYLLRRPEEKAKAWQDLQQVAGLLRA